jgi:hypothetical protein
MDGQNQDAQKGKDRNSFMTSEKALYWTALTVLALAGLNGFATSYRDWAGRLASRSIALAEQASDLAVQSVGQNDGNADPQQCLRSEVRLARTRSTIARHQAELVRMKAEAIRARVMAHEVVQWSSDSNQDGLDDVSDRIQLVEGDDR